MESGDCGMPVWRLGAGSLDLLEYDHVVGA